MIRVTRAQCLHSDKWEFGSSASIPTEVFKEAAATLYAMTGPLVGRNDFKAMIENAPEDADKVNVTFRFDGGKESGTGMANEPLADFHKSMLILSFLSGQMSRVASGKFRAVVENDPESGEVTIEFGSHEDQPTFSCTSQSKDGNVDLYPSDKTP